MSSQTEIRQRITDQIVTALEIGGLPPWRRPWSSSPNSGFPANVVSKRAYSGINPLLLSLASMEKGLSSKWWGTFNQWRELGCSVRSRPTSVHPGQWGTRIVFCRPVDRTRKNKDGEEKDERFWVLREYVVFNAEQVEGEAAERLQTHVVSNDQPVVDFESADSVIEATGAVIRHGGDRAYYAPQCDYIMMPPKAAFPSPQNYYGTLLHETVHWTGHVSRLDRLTSNSRFGDQSYAFEELVAEIGGCYLAAEIGIPDSGDLSNQHAYLQHWLAVLGKDTHAIFRAATLASKAVDFILSFSRTSTNESDFMIEDSVTVAV